MSDASWIRSYAGKSVYMDGGVALAGNYGNNLGTSFSANPRLYTNWDNVTGGGVMISDDGGIFDYNDAWLQLRSTFGLYVRSNSATNLCTFGMGDVTNAGSNDKYVITNQANWGYMGTSGNYWYQMYARDYNAAGNYYYFSDKKIKENVRPIDGALEKLMKIEGVVYDRKKGNLYNEKDPESNYNRLGFIAQNLQEVIPSAVTTDKERGILKAEYTSVLPVLVEAVKEQQYQIEELRASLNDFGSVAVTSREMWVNFSPEFVAGNKASLPVVTITSNKPAVSMYVAEKSGKGFKLVIASDLIDGLVIDYIAMAHSQNNNATTRGSKKQFEEWNSDNGSEYRFENSWEKQNAEAAVKITSEAVKLQQERKLQMESKGSNFLDPAKK